jgi:hypothetical protein
MCLFIGRIPGFAMGGHPVALCFSLGFLSNYTSLIDYVTGNRPYNG